MKQIGNDLYTNVGLYWTGTRVRLSTCTGTTIKNDGTTLTDFNGKIDIPPSPASGNLSYYSGTTITGFPGAGQNLDLQIIEPEASTSHLYTITCQTFSGGTVSDSILISNEVGDICGAGLVWDGLTCVASGVNSLQGNDCTIPANQSSCNASFNWDLNGASSPQVRNTTTNVTYPNANKAVTNAMHSIIYGPNIIQSRDGSTVLREITVTGRCTASAPWDSSRKVCYSAPSVPPTPPTPGTISVTVESAVVRKLDTTTVNWQISNPIPVGYT